MIDLLIGMRLDEHCLYNNKKTWSEQPTWAGLRVGKTKCITTYHLNPLHPLGRHPFNIITKEIYDD